VAVVVMARRHRHTSSLQRTVKVPSWFLVCGEATLSKPGVRVGLRAELVAKAVITSSDGGRGTSTVVLAAEQAWLSMRRTAGSGR